MGRSHGQEPTSRGRTAHSCVSVYCACTAGGAGTWRAPACAGGPLWDPGEHLWRGPGGDLEGRAYGKVLDGRMVQLLRPCVRDDPFRVVGSRIAHDVRVLPLPSSPGRRVLQARGGGRVARRTIPCWVCYCWRVLAPTHWERRPPRRAGVSLGARGR